MPSDKPQTTINEHAEIYEAIIWQDMLEFEQALRERRWWTVTGNPLSVIEGGKHEAR